MKFQTGELSKKELMIYRQGEKQAYVTILNLIHPENRVFWDEHKASMTEAEKFATMEVERLLDRIEKAKQIYIAQQAIISAASQISIDELIEKS